MIIWNNNDDVTIWQDAITMALRKAKWTHEVNTKMSLREDFVNFFWHAKDFAFTHEVAAEACKIQPTVTRWVKMASRMARWFHDLVSFVLSSWVEKFPIPTMIIRSKHDVVTIWQDPITMALRKAKWTHENNTKMSLREDLGQFFYFTFAHVVASEAWKIQPSVTKWVKMASRMARCFHDQTRVWTFSYSCVHLLSNSGQCDASMRSILAFSLALFAWFELLQILSWKGAEVNPEKRVKDLWGLISKEF